MAIKKAAQETEKKDLTTTTGGAMQAFFSEQAVGRDDDDAGNENVTSRDMVIPRIDLLQDLSPQVKRNDEAYIEGAEPGMLFNSLTGELYGNEVYIVPVFFVTTFNIWVDRKKGGGFRGAYTSEAAARAEVPRLAREEDLRESDFQIVETGNNYGFVLLPDGRVEEVAIAFSKTKLSASRKLNSLIRMTGGARWRRAYKLQAVRKKNNKGEFYTFDVALGPYVSEELYKRAQGAYEMFNRGFTEGRLRSDMSGAEEATAADDGEL